MELTDMVEGYELLRSTSQLDPLYSETGRIILLHDDQSVRVYLTIGLDSWEDITLEIEVFMGVSRKVKSVQSQSVYDYENDTSLSKGQLLECISLIEYLLRLEESGFKLEIVLDDCIWTARYTVNHKPDTQLFGIVVPPNHLEKMS